MSEIVTVRDSEIVAAEINTIKEDTRRIMIGNAIRIGGKLLEAKSMVPFGEWGKWLTEKVDYSQSTANNLMKLYQEYGDNQESLFDDWTKSETFANLTYSQHMALLALPFAERVDFAESHDVENMSTRELEKAIREELTAAQQENGDLRRKLDETEQALFNAQTELEYAKDDLDTEKTKARDAEKEQARLVEAMKTRAEMAEKEKSNAEKSEQNALNLVEKLNKQLAEAREAEVSVRQELKKAQENPEVPDTVMEQLRKEAESEAARNAAEELEKQLAAAQKTAQDAVSAREAAEAAARDAADKLAEAQKAAKMSDPDVVTFQAMFLQLQDVWNRAVGAYKKVGNETSAANCHKALEAALDKFHSDIT